MSHRQHLPAPVLPTPGDRKTLDAWARGLVRSTTKVLQGIIHWINNLAAGDVHFTPAGGLAAVDVQAALEELDAEKAPAALVESKNGFVEVVADKIYVVERKASYPYTIDEAALRCRIGTCDATVTIDGTNVTGLVDLAVSGAEAFGTATALNAVAEDQTVAVVVTNNAAAEDLAFTLRTTRT